MKNDDVFETLPGQGSLVSYCSCCRAMRRVHGAMGDWLRYCTRCDADCSVCFRSELPEVLASLAQFPLCPHFLSASMSG